MYTQCRFEKNCCDSKQTASYKFSINYRCGLQHNGKQFFKYITAITTNHREANNNQKPTNQFRIQFLIKDSLILDQRYSLSKPASGNGFLDTIVDVDDLCVRLFFFLNLIHTSMFFLSTAHVAIIVVLQLPPRL